MSASIRAAVLFLLGVGLTAAFAFIVFHESGSQWDATMSAATAAGTLLLAGATFYLGIEARDEVKQTTALALESQRPVLVEVGTRTIGDYNPTSGAGVLRVRIANVGGGPAIDPLMNIRPNSSLNREGIALDTVPDRIDALRVDEEHTFEIHFLSHPARDEAPHPYNLWVYGQCYDRGDREIDQVRAANTGH